MAKNPSGEIANQIVLALNQLGYILADQENPEDALLAFKVCLFYEKAFFPSRKCNCPGILMNMGTILRNLYRYDKAIFMYRGAIAAIAAAEGGCNEDAALILCRIAKIH